MKRERMLWGLVLFAALGGFFAVYQFYFKEKLADYGKDALALKNAQEAYKHLSEVFQNTKPEGVVGMWSAVVQPWKDAVIERGKYFNDEEWWKHTEPAENVAILRFWYDSQVKAEMNRLFSTVLQATPTLQQYPTNYDEILKEMGVMQLQEFRGAEVTKKEVNRELGKLATGIRVYEMLAKAKIPVIYQVWLWPVREVKEQDGLVRFWTYGIDVMCNMKTLQTFIDDRLRTDKRYWNIEGIKIQYPYVGYNVEPMLRVQMLLTAGTFVMNKSGTDENAVIPMTARGAAPGQVAANYGLKGKQAAPVMEELTGLAAFWKWFKVNILVTNN